MKLKNKWNMFTNNAKNGAKDLLEITKLKNAINDEERVILLLKSRIGQCVWEQYTEGEQNFCQTVLNHCQNIALSNEKIAEFQQKIEDIREAAKNREAENSETADQSMETDIQANCPNCGEPVQPNHHFCPNCGNALTVALTPENTEN